MRGYTKIYGIDYDSWLIGLGPNEISDVFTATIYSILSSKIAKKVVMCDDKNAPLVTVEVNTAIRRKIRASLSWF